MFFAQISPKGITKLRFLNSFSYTRQFIILFHSTCINLLTFRSNNITSFPLYIEESRCYFNIVIE